MDLTAIMQTAAQTFQGKLDADGDGQIEISDLIPALTGLFSNDAGEFDISSIMENLNAGGLMSLAQSWLGDGDNEPVSGEQITNILGSDKISAFASQLGLSEDQAIGGLQEAVPSIIDQVSSGGSLMDMAGSLLGGDNSAASGGLGGLLGMAGKLFGR